MNRETLLAFAAAAMGIVALAIAAATLDDLWRPEDPTGNGGEGPAGDPGPPEPVEPGNGFTIPYADEVMMALLLIVAILGVIYLLVHYREVALVLLAVAVGILIFYLLAQFVDFGDPFVRDPPEEFGEFVLPGENGGEEEPPDAHLDWLPVVAVIGVFAVVLVAAMVLTLRDVGTSIDSKNIAPGRSDPDSIVAADIGAAAGRAADRLEDGDAYENEVYRAWAEMTALLEIDRPETATPGDFAEEAIAAGLTPADVRDLTRLFEAVRYGNRPPTTDREERAVKRLRRIEDRYAEDS